MEREVGDFDLQSVIGLYFLNTPGTEVAPGSNIVGKDLKHQCLCHGALRLIILCFGKVEKAIKAASPLFL